MCPYACLNIKQHIVDVTRTTASGQASARLLERGLQQQLRLQAKDVKVV